MNDKPFKGFNHGTGKVDLRHLKYTIISMPVEIHLKEDGSLKNEPSFTFVFDSGPPGPVRYIAGEISLEMFNEGLADIGYKIVKKDSDNPFKKIADELGNPVDALDAFLQLAIKYKDDSSKFLHPANEIIETIKAIIYK